MIKSELCTRLSRECGITPDEAAMVVDVFFDSIAAALAKGARVELRGLCSWQVKEYEGYEGSHPITGEPIYVPPKTLPFFRPGKELLDRLNSQ